MRGAMKPVVCHLLRGAALRPQRRRALLQLGVSARSLGGLTTTTSTSSSVSALHHHAHHHHQHHQQQQQPAAADGQFGFQLAPRGEHALVVPESARHSGLTWGVLSNSGRNANELISLSSFYVQDGFKGSSKAAAPAPGASMSGLQDNTAGANRSFHKASNLVEVKMESQVVFNSVWRRFEDKHGKNFRIPREIVWLNGAPGSGKGANTEAITKLRSLNRAITVSSLLAEYPEARQLMDSGEMISDTLVGELLLESLLRSGAPDEYGILVDGFPRTALQVDFLKLLFEKLQEVHHNYADTPLATFFPRPSFKVVVLYVEEDTSIQRQLQRAQAASLHNKRVLDAGAGHLQEERITDVSVEKCRKRYITFKNHYSAMLRLKQFFPFHLIDAMGTLRETQEQIFHELSYQSSLDLREDTYTLIRRLPRAKDIVKTSQQQLVTRLDEYCERSPELFEQAIRFLESDVLPAVRQAGMAGQVAFKTRTPFLTRNAKCIDMIIDILGDRDFHVSYHSDELLVPTHLNLKTGQIEHRAEVIHTFNITFDTYGVKDQFKAMEIAARVAESARQANAGTISQSFFPEHRDEVADGTGLTLSPGEKMVVKIEGAKQHL